MRSLGNLLRLDQMKSGQRKLVYLGGIVLLMVGSILLGAPSTDENRGGMLPRMRTDYDLGESTLGEVDPSSATMNLVLLGLRGIAANVLWMEHEELKKTKNWARMEDTVNSIVTLQPHFLQVWRYHGWDLGYNVSSQWDDVRDRFYWVKEGTKFLMDGSSKNVHYAELPWDVGRFLGHKMGRSDEWRFFRKYFLKDPDPQEAWDGKLADPAINPAGDDNYEVARKWYLIANEIEEEIYKQKGKGQHQMMRELFRHYPARSYFDLADALHREGTFGDRSASVWNQAYDEWSNQFGKERFVIESGAGVYWMNPAGEEDITIMLKADEPLGYKVTREEKLRWIALRQNVTNYRYWKARADIEKEPDMVNAHRDMYKGREMLRAGQWDWNLDGTPPESVKKLESGLKLLEKTFQKLNALNTGESGEFTPDQQFNPDQKQLIQDDNLIEEAMLAIKYYREAHILSGIPLRDDYPLKWLWDANQDRVQSIDEEFIRDLGGRTNQ